MTLQEALALLDQLDAGALPFQNTDPGRYGQFWAHSATLRMVIECMFTETPALQASEPSGDSVA